jgi:lactoylglutathione lyase
MKYLHTMIRVSDPQATIRFFELLGLREVRRMDNEKGRFTLIFLAAPGDEDAQVELTHNWDEKGYEGGRNFGHLAYRVENIYETCQRLMDAGITINRPPS